MASPKVSKIEKARLEYEALVADIRRYNTRAEVEDHWDLMRWNFHNPECDYPDKIFSTCWCEQCNALRRVCQKHREYRRSVHRDLEPRSRISSAGIQYFAEKYDVPEDIMMHLVASPSIRATLRSFEGNNSISSRFTDDMALSPKPIFAIRPRKPSAYLDLDHKPRNLVPLVQFGSDTEDYLWYEDRSEDEDDFPSPSSYDDDDILYWKQKARQAIKSELDTKVAYFDFREKVRSRALAEKKLAKRKCERKIAAAIKQHLSAKTKAGSAFDIVGSLMQLESPFSFFVDLINGAWENVMNVRMNVTNILAGMFTSVVLASAQQCADKVAEEVKRIKEEIVSTLKQNVAAVGLFIMNLFMNGLTLSSLFLGISNLLLHIRPDLGRSFCTVVGNLITPATAGASVRSGLEMDVFHTLCTAVSGFRLPMKGFKDLTGKLKDLSAFKRGIVDAVSVFGLIQTAFDRLRIWWYGKTITGTIKDVDIPEFITGVLELAHLSPKDMADPQNMEMIKRVNKSASLVAIALGTSTVPHAHAGFLNSLVQRVIRFNEMNYDVVSQIPVLNRPAPYIIYVCGPSGSGKSAITPMLYKALLDPRNAPPCTRPFDRNNPIYRERTDTKFDNGYKNHTVWEIDDMFQQQTTENTPKEESDGLRLINLGSPGDLEVADSRSEYKARLMTSPLVHITSNAIYPDCPEVKEQRAVHRRRSYLTYATRVGEGPLDVTKMRFRRIPAVLQLIGNDLFPLDDWQKPIGVVVTDKNVSPKVLEAYIRTFPMLTFAEWVKDIAFDWNKRATSEMLEAFGADPPEDCYLTAEEKARCTGPHGEPIHVPEPVQMTDSEMVLTASVRSGERSLMKQAQRLLASTYMRERNPACVQDVLDYISTIRWVSLVPDYLVLYILFRIIRFLLKAVTAVVRAGSYEKDTKDQLKNRLRTGPKPRGLQELTGTAGTTRGNSVNTIDSIKDMVVGLVLTIGDKVYFNNGMAYCGRYILTNYHLGMRLSTEAPHKGVIRIKSPQGNETDHNISVEDVFYDDELKEDWCILRINSMRMYPDRRKFFLDEEQLPNKMDRVVAYSGIEQMCYMTGAMRRKTEVQVNGFVYNYVDWFETPLTLVKDGDCGSPLVDAQTGKIVGMFSACLENNTRSVFIPIWKRLLPGGPSGPELPGVVPVEYADIKGYAAPPELKNNVPRKTKLVKAPLHGIFEVRKAPAVLSPFHKNGDPLENGFKANFEPSLPIAAETLEVAVGIVGGHLAYIPEVVGKEPLEDDAVINGIPGKMKGIDLSTSLGLPYKKMTTEKGKHGVFELIDGQRRWRDTPAARQIQKDIQLMEEELKKGNVPAAFCTEQLKDEPLKLSKVEIGKTRTFRTPSLPINYLMRKYFGAFAAAAEKVAASFPIAVGIDAHGMDWTDLFTRLKRFGGLVIAGDYCQWDKKLQPGLICAMKKVFTQWYGTKDEVVRNALIDYLITNPVIVNEFMCFVEQGLPSGIAMTSIFGSVINYIIIVSAIYEILKKANRLDLLDPKRWETTFYGDDHIVALDEELREFVNFNTLKEFIDSHGMGYTDAAKLGLTNDFDHLTEVPFLKRTFKIVDGGKIMAPLDMTSIEGMVHWRESSLPAEEHVPAIWDSLVCELVYHGPDEFSRVLEKVLEEYKSWCSVVEQTRPRVLVANYGTALAKWRSKVMC